MARNMYTIHSVTHILKTLKTARPSNSISICLIQIHLYPHNNLTLLEQTTLLLVLQHKDFHAIFKSGNVLFPVSDNYIMSAVESGTVIHTISLQNTASALLSPFLIRRTFLREPSWKYSAKLVGS